MNYPLCLPKIRLLYYKNILDACFVRFFTDFNDCFICQSGAYVYGSKMSASKLKRVFREYVCDEIRKHIAPSTLSSMDCCFIIGSCLPKHNILLDLKGCRLSAKLQKLVDADYAVKYVLKEKDIKLDLVQFNAVLEDLFNEFFRSPRRLQRCVGKDYTNMFFLQHARLDCLTMYKLVKRLYGRSCVVNVFKEKLAGQKQVLCSINELIDKHVPDKSAVNSLEEFQLIAREVKQYIDECMKSAHGKKQAKNTAST